MTRAFAEPGNVSRRGVLPAMGGALASGAAIASLAGAATAQTSFPSSAALQPGLLQDRSTCVVLGPGVYQVPHDMELRGDLALAPGAEIAVTQGCTLRIFGAFSAPIARVFSGAGHVDLNASRAPVAYPEWWGAVTDDPNADCRPAIAACIAAHPVTQLRVADYHLADTLVIDRPHRRIWGAGYRGVAAGQGTRLIIASGAADVVRVGPAKPPGQVNDFLQGIDLRWMDLSRSRPVDAAGASMPAGLRAQYLLFCQFEGLSSRENGCGFVATGLVRSQLRDCIAFRSFDGDHEGAPWRGFWLNGDAEIGLAGGNGSIFLIDCNASLGGAPNVSDPVGLLMNGGFSDSYIINFETTGIATGIRLDGEARLIGQRAVAGHANVHIRMPIIDQCANIGIEILDTSEHALIELAEPYVGLAPDGKVAIALTQFRGGISILGGQVLGRMNAEARGNAIGLQACDSRGLMVEGLKLLDVRRPVVLQRCVGGVLRGWISNPLHPAQDAAVSLDNCQRFVVALQVGGGPRAFQGGVSITPHLNPSAALRIDTNVIDVAALARPEDHVLVNGRPMSAAEGVPWVTFDGR